VLVDIHTVPIDYQCIVFRWVVGSMWLGKALRRADWLAEMQQLLATALVLVTAAGVVSLVVSLTGRAVGVGLAARSVLAPGAGLRDGLVADPAGDVTVVIEHPDAGQIVLHLLTQLPVWVISVLMLFLLWRLVRAARRTDPFSEPVARRLAVLGWLLIVGGPVAQTVGFLASFVLAGTVSHPQATLVVMPLLVWMLAGFGMLAVGEVVRRGHALRAELDTVV
jgi:hypothetical protein